VAASKDSYDEVPGFWKDWFTRIGVGIWVAIIIGLLIHDLLVKMGVIRPLKGATLQDLEYFENYMYMSAIYPGLIGFFLIVMGAYRALRRKKIFR
jgi:hypothetical protein